LNHDEEKGLLGNLWTDAATGWPCGQRRVGRHPASHLVRLQ